MAVPDEREILLLLRQQRADLDRVIQRLAQAQQARGPDTPAALQTTVRVALQQQGVSLRQAAAAMGTSAATLSRFLRGQQVPGVETQALMLAWAGGGSE